MAKKWKIHTAALLVRMTPELKEQVAQNAEKQGASQSDIIRVAIEMYLADYEERMSHQGCGKSHVPGMLSTMKELV